MPTHSIDALPEKDIEVLRRLAADLLVNHGHGAGWLLTKHVGGTDNSHHTLTLKKLWQHGLISRGRVNPEGARKPIYAYRIRAVGLTRVKEADHGKDIQVGRPDGDRDHAP